MTVVGQARAVTDAAEYTRLLTLPLTPWAPGSHDHFIVIGTDHISGRHIPG